MQDQNWGRLRIHFTFYQWLHVKQAIKSNHEKRRPFCAANGSPAKRCGSRVARLSAATTSTRAAQAPGTGYLGPGVGWGGGVG